MEICSNAYETELNALAETYKLAMGLDIKGLKCSIAGASESSIIGIGSGGSFTVASLLCTLHEAYTGRVSRPSTPLEIISNPTLASTSPVFIVSAEGNNPDAVEALHRARLHSSRTIHLITNRTQSPLLEKAKQLTDIYSFPFEVSQKDGYLATNSLIMNAVLIARAYGELDADEVSLLPSSMVELKLGGKKVDEWLEEAEEFVEKTVRRGNIIVIYSPLLQPIAIDFESKLSEAALLFSQFSDIRSFAHGRHLWLSRRQDVCSILTIVDSSLLDLWDHMKGLIPESIPCHTMQLDSNKPRDLLAGLIAQMYLIAKIGRLLNYDPGKPDVPDFSRKLYYTDLPQLVPKPDEQSSQPQVSKFNVLGTRWPPKPRHGLMDRASRNYKEEICARDFKSVIFDYDGTLCSSQRKDTAPEISMITKLNSLIEHNIIIGIASGRGGSIHEILREAIPREYWGKIWLGLYNAGKILTLESELSLSEETDEFLNHVGRILNQLKHLGVPVENIKKTHPYQVSVRFREGISTEYMWFVVADALRHAGLDDSRIVASKHSIDILSMAANKSRLVAYIIEHCKINPYEIITIGDQGAWPGNDSALLEHRFSLSVDIPSRQIDRGWNFAPSHKRGVDATMWYLSNIEINPNGLRLKL